MQTYTRTHMARCVIDLTVNKQPVRQYIITMHALLCVLQRQLEAKSLNLNFADRGKKPTRASRWGWKLFLEYAPVSLCITYGCAVMLGCLCLRVVSMGQLMQACMIHNDHVYCDMLKCITSSAYNIETNMIYNIHYTIYNIEYIIYKI